MSAVPDGREFDRPRPPGHGAPPQRHQAPRPRSPGRQAAPPAGRWLATARIDPSRGQRPPAAGRLLAATVVSVGGSLAADVALVHLGTALFPSTAGFGHFEFSDYATLTVIGVLGACLGWPVVARMSSAPRWLLLRLAVVVTLVLWVPDVWIALRGENPRAVAVLMVMHLVIAVITYNALVHLAPARQGRTTAGVGARSTQTARSLRRAWDAMAALVALAAVLGVATIVVVPADRPTEVVPAHDAWLYIAHAGLGLVLGVGALGLLAISGAADRLGRTGAVVGALGVGVAGIGGAICTFEHLRIVGMALMLVGTVVGGFGYLLPALDAFGEAERRRAGAPPGQEPPPLG